MRLVEVDVVGTEPTQRRVYAFEDVFAGQTGVVGALGSDGEVDLGEDLERFATLALQRVTEDRFRSPVGVDIGGIECGDACIESRTHALGRDVVLHLRTMGQPIAVRDLRNLQSTVSEVSVSHVRKRYSGDQFTSGRRPRNRVPTPARTTATTAAPVESHSSMLGHVELCRADVSGVYAVQP